MGEDSIAIQIAIALFIDLVRQILDKSSEDGLSLFAWAEYLIHQFRLEHSGITPEDVISEVIIRGIRHLEAGKAMPVPTGWVNRAIYNCVRERSRSVKKQDKLVSELKRGFSQAQDEDEEVLIAGRSIDELKTALKQAARTLKPRERRILYYQHVYGWDWKRISEELVSRGEPSQSLDSLRQQASRAKKRLRREILLQLSRLPV